MNVLRIQNKDGHGCYANAPTVLYEALGGSDEFEPPCPQHDRGIKRKPEPNERCGFLNKEQLDNWFGDDGDSKFTLLAEYDFKITVVNNVKITAIGERQVLFVTEE